MLTALYCDLKQSFVLVNYDDLYSPYNGSKRRKNNWTLTKWTVYHYRNNNIIIHEHHTTETTIDYSINYTINDSYCNSKSTVAFSSHVTHINWFCDYVDLALKSSISPTVQSMTSTATVPMTSSSNRKQFPSKAVTSQVLLIRWSPPRLDRERKW